MTDRDTVPAPARTWRVVMGLALDAVLTPAQLRSAYARAAFRLHPDYGGTHEQMSELNAAMLAAKRELGVP